MRKIIFAIFLMILILPLVNAQTQQSTNDPGVTPDSFLWGLDKALDQLTLLLTFNKGEKARKGLEISRERLLEVREMVEENKLEAAEKAKEDHGKNLLKVKQSIKEIEEDDSLEEIEEVIEIERELEEHDEEVEQTFGELKVKVEVEGEITQQQKDLIDSILNSLKGQTGDVEIEIKNKKNKIKIEIERETDKSEEEIEIEIEEIEREKGIKKQEKALDAIEDAKEEFDEFLAEAKEKEIVVSQDLINQFNALLEQATNEFDQGNFIDAKKLAKQAEKLLDEREEFQEGEHEEIKVEIEEGKAKVEVEIGREELKFVLETTDLDTILNEISTRTGLSLEEINNILEVEIEEEEEEEIEIEAEAEKGRTKVKVKVGGLKQRFMLDVTSQEDVITEIVARTGLTEDVVRTNLEFEVEEELEEESEEETEKEEKETEEESEELEEQEEESEEEEKEKSKEKKESEEDEE